MSEKALSRFDQPIAVPGRRLLHHIPLRFVRKKVVGGGQRAMNHEIPLIPFIDFLLCIVLFLLASFSASGELPIDKNIKLPNAEFENPVVDRAALDSVALCTGGRTFDLTQGKDAADLFKIGRVTHLLEHRHEIWDAPILWVSLFVILCLEWILRKRARLI